MELIVQKDTFSDAVVKFEEKINSSMLSPLFEKDNFKLIRKNNVLKVAFMKDGIKINFSEIGKNRAAYEEEFKVFVNEYNSLLKENYTEVETSLLKWKDIMGELDKNIQGLREFQLAADKASKDVMQVENVLKNMSWLTEFRLLVDDINKIYIAWAFYRDSNGFRLLIQQDHDGELASIPFLQSKLKVRTRYAPFLNDFIKKLKEELEG